MTEAETERFNRLLRDVFWLRHGREPDLEDPDDQRHWDRVWEWAMRGAWLPGEAAEEAHERNEKQRVIRELTA